MDPTISQKTIKAMAKKKSKPTRQQIVTKQLLKQQETNEKLREKEISTNFFKLFNK